MRGLALKIALTAVVLIVVMVNVDIGAAIVRFGALSWTAAALCLVLGLLQIGLLAWRWVIVARLTSVPLPISEALRCALAAQFFSQGLPASVGGDALRIWWLTRLGVRLGAALRCVMLDRIAGLVSLFLLNVIAAALLIALVNRVGSGLEIAAAVALGIAVAVMGTSRSGRRVALSALRLVPRRVRGRKGVRTTVLWALKLQRAASALLFSPTGLSALAWGVGIHLVTVLLAWIIARDTGLDTGFLALFAVVMPVLMLSYLPLSIGGWGVREGGMAFALTLIGHPADAGVFLGLALGALGLGSALLGAVVWLISPMPVTLLGRPREMAAGTGDARS